MKCCVSCGYVVNRLMKRPEIETWLDFLSHLSRDESIKISALNIIESRRDFYDINNDDTPLCRHCLIEISILVATNQNSEMKLRGILKEYDFDDAIIC